MTKAHSYPRASSNQLRIAHFSTTTFIDQTFVSNWQDDTICFGFFTGRGKGRGRSRNDDEEEGTGGRPSGPSTLFDFLESKMGVFSIDGEWSSLRVPSHLTRSKTWGRFSFALFRLDICEHSNRTLAKNKTTEPRSPRRGGLGWIPFDPQCSLFAVKITTLALSLIVLDVFLFCVLRAKEPGTSETSWGQSKFYQLRLYVQRYISEVIRRAQAAKKWPTTSLP